MIRQRNLILLYGVALVAFSCLFAGFTFNFWLQMALTVSVLCLATFVVDGRGMQAAVAGRGRSVWQAIVAGAASAALLYAVFFAVNFAVQHCFPAGAHDISSVYALRHGTNTWLMMALIALIIGPGEEILWRGCIQRGLEEKHGIAGTALGVLAYTSVHLASGNLMLVSAALFCGMFWGLIYRRFGSLWLNIISHVLWDLAIFIVWPLQQ